MLNVVCTYYVYVLMCNVNHVLRVCIYLCNEYCKGVMRLLRNYKSLCIAICVSVAVA